MTRFKDFHILPEAKALFILLFVVWLIKATETTTNSPQDQKSLLLKDAKNYENKHHHNRKFVHHRHNKTHKHANMLPKVCLNYSDCDVDKGEFCYHLYEGCEVGQCMCDVTTPHVETVAHCIGKSRKQLNGSCSKDEECLNNLRCTNNTCVCTPGSNPSDDKNFCFSPSVHRLLNQVCIPSLHLCLQKSGYGYTSNDVICHQVKHQCQCAHGFKNEAGSCSRRKAGEVGCKVPYQCVGGAMCVDGVCTCPTGYHVPRGYEKCVRKGALLRVPLGGLCDEINEKAYCAADLVCHKCQPTSPYSCVRFKREMEFLHLISSSSFHPSLFTRLLALLSFTIYLTVFTTNIATLEKTSKKSPLQHA